MKYRVFNLGGRNLKISPFLQAGGELLRCVNLDNDYIGGKTKRPGYGTFCGTANGSAVLDLFSWTKADGTSTYVYRNSGGRLYYWDAGVGTALDWTVCGAGTITAGNHIGQTVMAETLIVDQVGGTARSSTTGTSFADISGAPAGEHLTTYQNRVFIGGTASTLFWSASGSGTDWATSGTSDSSSITIPGAGKINKTFVSNDYVITSKNSGLMYRWDGYSLRRLPTDQGISSPYSLGETEDYHFYLNRNGIYGFDGTYPKILSNYIEREIYNNAGNGITGSNFDTAPGIVHHYNYLLSVGATVSDNLTNESITNAVIKYDYQQNLFSDYSFANSPTAWTTYKDNTGNVQLLFGDSSGQVYKIDGTATSDNGTPIEAVMEGILNFGDPDNLKLFKEFTAVASPGCGASIQISATDSFTSSRRKWIDVGQFKDGIAKIKPPSSTVGRLLGWRVVERSSDAPFTIYGFVIDFDTLKS